MMTAVSTRKAQACPLMYECPKVNLVPMIRSLRRCTAAEAMESVCSDCADRPQRVEPAPLKSV